MKNIWGFSCLYEKCLLSLYYKQKKKNIMGYTPTIIIDHNELASKVSELEDMSWRGDLLDDPNEQEIFDILISIAKSEPFVFREHFLTTLTTDLTGRNARYREILDELGVYYSLDY